MKFLMQATYIIPKTIKICPNQHTDFHRFLFTEDFLKIKKDLKLVSWPHFSYIFFHFMLSWSCAVHKVQGNTISNTFGESFDLKKLKRFNTDQVYVALSRWFIFDWKI